MIRLLRIFLFIYVNIHYIKSKYQEVIVQSPGEIDHFYDTIKDTSNFIKKNNLQTYLNDLSIISPALGISNKKEFGRGLSYYSKKNISKNEIIFKIPIHSMMSIYSANKTRIHLLMEANPDLPEAIILALHILYEKIKGKTSKWFSFIQTMLNTLDSPIFYNDEEMNIIEGSYLSRLTKSRLDAIEKFYNALKDPVTSEKLNPPLFNKDLFTFENFKWALGTVWSQSTLLTMNISNSNITNAYLIPILNTIGHCHNCMDTIGLDEKNEYIMLLATNDIPIQSTIRINLKKEESALYMLNYGFFPPPISQDNILPFSIYLEKNDTLYDIKVFLLNQLNKTIESPYYLRYNTSIMNDKDMLRTMRIKLLYGNEIELKDNIFEGKPISLRNEYAVCRSLYQSCNAMLSKYSTTIDKDEKLFVDPLISEKKRNQLLMLMFEKKLLINAKRDILQCWENILLQDIPLK